MGSENSISQQILYYYVFQKKIEKFFKGEKMKDSTKIHKGYVINPEWIKEWRRRINYANIRKKCFEIFNIETTKLDKEQEKLILDIIAQKDEKILYSDENNKTIIKYKDFMFIDEKILTEKYLENFVNEKTFKLMNLNEKITFEEIKYIL